MKTKVVIGNKYGMLTPIRVVGKDKFGLLLYLCECDCGKQKVVRSSQITTGKTVSCGCKRAKQNNLSRSITYKSWISAKQRCYNPNNHNYPNYGGRGIEMCERWKNSFIDFINDMGERPSKKHTLDRIDVNGNYEPSNCKWSTPKEQGNNRRDNHFVSFNEETMTTTQFAEKYDIGIPYLFYALRKGFSLKEIIIKYEVIRKKSKGSKNA